MCGAEGIADDKYGEERPICSTGCWWDWRDTRSWKVTHALTTPVQPDSAHEAR